MKDTFSGIIRQLMEEVTVEMIKCPLREFYRFNS